MFRTILIWLGLFDDPRPHTLPPEYQARLDRLDAMLPAKWRTPPRG